VVPEADAPAPSRAPHPGYRPCVGVLLVGRDGRVLIGRRSDRQEAWQPPQGGIDAGEDPTVAALRELREEIGTDRARLLRASAWWRAYDLPAGLRGTVGWADRYRGQTQIWAAFRFIGSDADIRLDAHEPEFDAWRWVEPAELLALTVAFKRPVIEGAITELADALTPG
jgi:putative (di)nucleoside polyphosphate hydrolase